MIEDLAKKAKKASGLLRLATTEEKNRALLLIAEALEKDKEAILAANEVDLAEAKDLPAHLLDRLSLKGRLEGIIADVKSVAELPDPVGTTIDSKTLPNGLKIERKRVPLGVIGVIYESRPNVTVDITALCLKTGNCALLRGGSETLHTNQALARAIQSGLKKADLPSDAIQLIESKDRAAIKEMIQLDRYIDMIIPRGGEKLQRFCLENSTIPVITGGAGICHLYVEKSADLAKSIDVIINAKVQRPSACNALDTILVDSAIASTFVPRVTQALRQKNVTCYLDERAIQYDPSSEKATDDLWDREWLSLALAIKVVDSLDDAIAHIEAHSRGHSDGIMTSSKEAAERFVKGVDSAAVYVNASTRFTDGSQFGLGAEVAISTQKLHARGPLGLQELTTYKWIVTGDYHKRS